ncbi:MAG: agmatine deiminase family protein [Bacteroidota bacterium]|nr:agmatine deiminase family protein [Bacteroidota bacterium]
MNLQRIMRLTSTGVIAMALSVSAWSQTPTTTPLPKDISDGEMEQWLAHPLDLTNPSTLRGIPTPPPGSNLRTAAEWEEIEVLTITWEGFPCILKQITAASVEECRVVIFSENVSQTTSYLTGNSCGGPVAMDSVEVVDAASNSIWIRDYGANTVYTEYNDGRVLVDWLYNRPRPDDDAIPDVLAAHMGLDLYSTIESPGDLMNTGGNWMSDGYGTAFASELILEENGGGTSWWTTFPDHTEEEINQIVQAYHGVDTYVKMDVLPYDGIHHIDMHMKLLDESTLLVSEYPTGVADGPQIEANLQYVLSNFTTKWGTPFDVVRIPSPPQYGGGYPSQNGDYLTYSNATFVNNTILLPTYYEQYDTTAIRIWEEAMPGYNVVGIDCDSGNDNIISLSGAIHCITHSVGVADPLMISHLPLPDTDDTENAYAVTADLSHRSGLASVTLSWATSPEGPWTDVAMTETNAALLWSEYEVDIPAQAEGTTVHYYISAEANSGKTGARPMPAPEGWWSFKVLGETSSLDDEDATSPWQSLYPNPARAVTCLELNLPQMTTCEVVLHNVFGQKVRTLHQGTLNRGVQRVFVDASTLAAGPYLVSLTTAQGSRWTERLVVEE